MPAANTVTATEQFASLLWDLADGDPDVTDNLTITDPAQAGWLVPERRTLLVSDGTSQWIVEVSQVT